MSLLGFPTVVNEYAARLVASGVVGMTVIYLVTGSGWVLVPLVYGFVARVLSGPRFSPLALLVTRVVVPRLGLAERSTPGPPKRFAQAIGATLAGGAAVAHLAGASTPATVLIAAITAAATLEAALGFCLGCRIFALLMRVGAIPAEICEACNDINGAAARRLRQSTTS